MRVLATAVKTSTAEIEKKPHIVPLSITTLSHREPTISTRITKGMANDEYVTTQKYLCHQLSKLNTILYPHEEEAHRGFPDLGFPPGPQFSYVP
jgi:hypothetical protein